MDFDRICLFTLFCILLFSPTASAYENITISKSVDSKIKTGGEATVHISIYNKNSKTVNCLLKEYMPEGISPVVKQTPIWYKCNRTKEGQLIIQCPFEIPENDKTEFSYKLAGFKEPMKIELKSSRVKCNGLTASSHQKAIEVIEAEPKSKGFLEKYGLVLAIIGSLCTVGLITFGIGKWYGEK